MICYFKVALFNHFCKFKAALFHPREKTPGKRFLQGSVWVPDHPESWSVRSCKGFYMDNQEIFVFNDKKKLSIVLKTGIREETDG